MSVIPHESIVHNVTQTAKSEVNGITKLPTSSFELVLSVQTQQHGVKGSELLDRHCCPSDKSTSKKRLENSSRNPSQSPNKPALCPSPASSSCPAVRHPSSVSCPSIFSSLMASMSVQNPMGSFVTPEMPARFQGTDSIRCLDVQSWT